MRYAVLARTYTDGHHRLYALVSLGCMRGPLHAEGVYLLGEEDYGPYGPPPPCLTATEIGAFELQSRSSLLTTDDVLFRVADQDATHVLLVSMLASEAGVWHHGWRSSVVKWSTTGDDACPLFPCDCPRLHLGPGPDDRGAV